MRRSEGLIGDSMMVPALLPDGGDDAAQDGEVPGPVPGSETPGDLLPQFHHPQVALGLVVGERDLEDGQEAKHRALSIAQPHGEVVTDPPLPAPPLAGLGRIKRLLESFLKTRVTPPFGSPRQLGQPNPAFGRPGRGSGERSRRAPATPPRGARPETRHLRPAAACARRRRRRGRGRLRVRASPRPRAVRAGAGFRRDQRDLSARGPARPRDGAVIGKAPVVSPRRTFPAIVPELLESHEAPRSC